MSCDLSQPIFNNVPQQTMVHPISIRRAEAFPVIIENASGGWTRAVAWDEGEMA